MSAPERIPPQRMTSAAVAGVLAGGRLTVHGRIPDASNGVLYCTAEDGDLRVRCVYKPVAAERPLWDFPHGTLARREAAAYAVSEATGWGLVPVTVLREGPLGEGMCQLWVGPPPVEDGADADADGARVTDSADAAGRTAQVGGEVAAAAADQGPGADDRELLGPLGRHGLLALVDGEEPGPGWKAVGFAETGTGRPALLVHADDIRLRRLAVLDAVINNGDRKGRHLLHSADGRLYAIDHGVSFHVDDKLRTLLWGWAGRPLPDEALRVLRRLATRLADGNPLADRLGALISPAELEAVRKRTDGLLSSGCFPLPGGGWPAIPWPPI